MFEGLTHNATQFIEQWGYLGLFIVCFLDGSLVPLITELIIIPAGYLAARGSLDPYMVFLVSTGGNILGAWFDYYLAKLLGKPLLYKYGKYVFITPNVIDTMERFFVRFGSLSIILGRLTPGVRQLISLPAGLVSMNIGKFTLATVAGAGVWGAVLVYIGYAFGANQEAALDMVKAFTLPSLIAIALIAITTYVIISNVKKRIEKSLLQPNQDQDLELETIDI